MLICIIYANYCETFKKKTETVHIDFAAVSKLII